MLCWAQGCKNSSKNRKGNSPNFQLTKRNNLLKFRKGKSYQNTERSRKENDEFEKFGMENGEDKGREKFFSTAFFQVWKRAGVRKVFLSLVFSILTPHSLSELFHYYYNSEKDKSVFLKPWLSGPIGEVVPFAGPAIALHQRRHLLNRIVDGVMRLLARWTLW